MGTVDQADIIVIMEPMPPEEMEALHEAIADIVHGERFGKYAGTVIAHVPQ